MIDFEPLIIARLEDPNISEVSRLVTTICSTAIFNGALNPDELLPFCAVKPSGGAPLEQSFSAEVLAEEQIWTVIVAIKYDGSNESKGTYQDAKPILSAVRSALAGWAPVDPGEPVKYRGWEEPVHFPGRIEIPLNFSMYYEG